MKPYLLAAALISAALIMPRPLPAGLADAPWPMYQKDMFHTANTTLRGPDISAAAVLFSAYVEGRPSSAVIDASGTAYIGSADGCVYAVSPEGDSECIHNTGGPVSATPVLTDNDTLFAGTDNGTLLGLTTGGSLLWDPVTLEHGIVSAPALGPSGSLFVATSGDNDREGELYCISISSGDILWSYDTGSVRYSCPAVDASGNVYVGSYAGNIYSLTSRGTLRWIYESGETIISSPVIDRTGTVYAATSSQLIALSASAGEKLWTYSPSAVLFGMETPSGFVSGPALDQDGKIYAAGLVGDLHCLNASGEQLWCILLNEPTLADPEIPVVLSPPVTASSPERESGNYLYVRVKNTLYACDPATQSVLSFPFSDPLDQGSNTASTEPAIALGPNRMLYIPSAGGSVYGVGPDPAQGFTLAGALDGIPDDYPEDSRNEMRVCISDGQNTIEALIDDQGSYAVSGLEPGTYTVFPDAEGLIFDPPSSQVRIGFGDIGGVDFAVSAAAPFINRSAAYPGSIDSYPSTIELHADICNTGDRALFVSADFSALNGPEEQEMSAGNSAQSPWQSSGQRCSSYYTSCSIPAGLSLGPKPIPVVVTDGAGTLYDKNIVSVDIQSRFSGNGPREFTVTIEEALSFLSIRHRLGAVTAAASRAEAFSTAQTFELAVFAPDGTPVEECSAPLTSELQSCEIADPALGTWRLTVTGTGGARTLKMGAYAGGMQTGSQYSVSTSATGIGIVFGNVADAATGAALNDIQVRTTTGAAATAQEGYYLMLSPAGAFTVTTQDFGGTYAPAAKSVNLMSGDTAEANFRLDQGGAGPDAGCPAEELFGSASAEADRIRAFRDTVLNKTADGQRYVDLYYRHAAEICAVMDADPVLKKNIRSLAADMLSLLTAMAHGRPCRLTGTQKAGLLNCLSGIRKHAGPALAGQLDGMIETITSGRAIGVHLSGRNRQPQQK